MRARSRQSTAEPWQPSIPAPVSTSYQVGRYPTCVSFGGDSLPQAPPKILERFAACPAIQETGELSSDRLIHGGVADFRPPFNFNPWFTQNLTQSIARGPFSPSIPWELGLAEKAHERHGSGLARIAGIFCMGLEIRQFLDFPRGLGELELARC
jgi:hypothetical protein